MARRKRSGCLFFIIILLAVCVGAYLTNPPEEVHKEVARQKLEKIAENTLAKYGVGNNVLSSLGLDAGSVFVKQLLDNHISSDNYYLFSLTKLNWEGNSYIIGVGAFNKVFISNKVDEIAEKAIDDYLKNKILDLIPGIENIFR